MITVEVAFSDGRTLTIGKLDPRNTVRRVEELMWRYGQAITRINVVARGLEMAEAARMRHYFNMVEFDLRINTSMDRIGPREFDLYELAKYPRKGAAC